MRHAVRVLLALLFVGHSLGAQTSDTTSRGDKTFLTKRDLALSGLALGATALLSVWDPDISLASRDECRR